MIAGKSNNSAMRFKTHQIEPLSTETESKKISHVNYVHNVPISATAQVKTAANTIKGVSELNVKLKHLIVIIKEKNMKENCLCNLKIVSF